jgi:hypothetical protein
MRYYPLMARLVFGMSQSLDGYVDGELDVAGPELAAAVAPLIDEYRLYFRPYVLGGGKPYFAGAHRPPAILEFHFELGIGKQRHELGAAVGEHVFVF